MSFLSRLRFNINPNTGPNWKRCVSQITTSDMDRRLLVSSVLLGSGLGSFCYFYDVPPRLLWTHTERFVRSSMMAALVAGDYKWTLRYLEEGDEGWNEVFKNDPFSKVERNSMKYTCGLHNACWPCVSRTEAPMSRPPNNWLL